MIYAYPVPFPSKNRSQQALTYTAFIFDSFQVHERDINTDFLLILLRDLLKQRPDLRVVLMVRGVVTSNCMHIISLVDFSPTAIVTFYYSLQLSMLTRSQITSMV